MPPMEDDYSDYEQRASRALDGVRGAKVVPIMGGINGTDDYPPLEAYSTDGTPVQKNHKPGQSDRFPLLSFTDLEGLPQPNWRIRNVLPESGIGVLYGPPACGKSFLSLHMLGHVAAGTDWFGNRVTSCPVVYVALEGQSGIRQRSIAYRKIFSGLFNEVHERMRYVISRLDILEPADRRDFCASLQAAGFKDGIVCVDTLNRAAPGADENDSREMGRIISALQDLQRCLGGLIMAVHHSGKDSAKGMRGHSSLLAAVDVAIEVKRNGKARSWEVLKSKDGTDGKALDFKLDVVEIGEDDMGDPITSCYVSEIHKVDERPIPDKPNPPQYGNGKIIWDMLGKILKKKGDSRPPDAPGALPVGRPCISVPVAIDKLSEAFTDEELRRRREKARRGVEALQARGCVIVEGGYIWIR